MTETVLLTIAASLVAALFGLLAAIVGWSLSAAQVLATGTLNWQALGI